MPESRPNIILINTDQQRFDTIAALGADYMETPNLDRLVEEGVSFTNCHVNAPSCAPSRASLFTGYYPHTTGIYKNGDDWRHSWIEDLSNSGYHTVNIGKMHTAPYDTPMGFDERYEVENKDRYGTPVPADEPELPSEKYYLDEWDRALQARGLIKQQREFYRQWDDNEERIGAFPWTLPEDLHPDVFVGDRTTWWLDTMPRLDKPLFLEVGFPGPHPPFDPVERWAEKYMDRDLPEPLTSEEDLDGQPTPMKQLRELHEHHEYDALIHQQDASSEQRHRQRAYYFANVSMIDEKVGEIMNALERNGYEDTIVIFTSDHGEALGDHGHIQKWTMYDIVTRVPTIIWSPDRFEGGRQIDELIQLFDLSPTILEYADVDVPESMEAESLRPALEEGTDTDGWEGRDYVFSEHARDGLLQQTDFMTMVRSEDWKFVHFVDWDEGMLFNLNEDPDEEENLWDDPDLQDKKQEFRDILLEWRIQSGITSADWASDFR